MSHPECIPTSRPLFWDRLQVHCGSDQDKVVHWKRVGERVLAVLPSQRHCKNLNLFFAYGCPQKQHLHSDAIHEVYHFHSLYSWGWWVCSLLEWITRLFCVGVLCHTCAMWITERKLHLHYSFSSFFIICLNYMWHLCDFFFFSWLFFFSLLPDPATCLSWRSMLVRFSTLVETPQLRLISILRKVKILITWSSCRKMPMFLFHIELLLIYFILHTWWLPVHNSV